METKGQKINYTAIASQNLKERDFWKNVLSGDIHINGFYYDKRDSDILMDNYQYYQSILENQSLQKLLKICNNSDSRLFIVLAAVLSSLIYKYTDKEEIIIGSTIYRQKEDLNLINKLLLLRTSFNDRISFKTLLLQTKENYLKCVEHQNFPLDIYQKEFLGLDIGIILDNIHKEEYLDQVKPKMVFIFSLKENDLLLTIKYSELYYQKDSIVNIGRNYFSFLKTCLNNLDEEISSLDILSAEERNQLLYEFNNNQDTTIGNKTIIELFEDQVRKTPHDTALVFEGKKLKYSELNRFANQLARYIIKKNYNSGSIVGLLIDRSLEMVVTIIAIMKARMAYLPIATNTPKDRINYLLMDSEAVLLIYNKIYKTLIENENPISNGRIILEEDNWRNEDDSNLNLLYQGTDLAYVLYTSGSTGRPKGVLVEQSNIVNTLQWFGKTYDIKNNKNIIQLTNYIFDPSIEQIFGALLNGGILHIPINEILSDYRLLQKYIVDNKINIINFTPRFLYELLGNAEKFESLRIVISGGEKLEESVKVRILEKGYTLYNHYGPTEVAVDALYDQCSNLYVNLGKPIANTKVFILGKQLNLRPIGVSGKLYISGRGVTRGYLKNNELTSKKFIKNSFYPEEYMYDTGDIVRWLPDGRIEFLGREDNQVKIRGYRIEIEEIESVILEMEDIKEAVVTVVENNSDKYLSAFIVSDKRINLEELRFSVSKKLPHYMTPTSINQVEKIPRNNNGKIDRKFIHDTEIFKKYSAKSFKAPETDLEKKITEIWKQILKVETVGVNENFFELGGNSMNIIQLGNMVNESLSENITVVNIFDNPTIHSLSVFLEERNSLSKIESNNFESSTDRMKNSIHKMKGILNG